MRLSTLLRGSIALPAVLGILGACSAPPSAPARTVEVDAAPPVLYGRDGKPVGAPARGVADEQQPSGGRLTLLELYQKSCQERDALFAELDLVRADLERTQAALLAAQQRVAEFETQSGQELAALDALRAENLELAARLATAHLRRMEAEKRVLELEIAALAQVDPSTGAPPEEPAR